MKYYDKTISKAPKYGLAYINKGEKLNRLGRYEEAIETFKLAVRQDKNERAHFGLGEALLALRYHKEALTEYKKGLFIDSKNVLAWKNAGEAAFRAGKFGTATAAYEKAIKLYKWDANLYYCVADSLRHQKKLKKARTYIMKGLRVRPSHESLRALLQALTIQAQELADSAY